MNEMKHLEELLSSWKPRNASPEVRRQLFGQPAEKPQMRGSIFALVAPMAACLLAVASFIYSTGSSPSHESSIILFASISSNATVSPWSEEGITLTRASASLQQNVWDKATFDWTNQHLSTSSIRSLTAAQTNDLR